MGILELRGLIKIILLKNKNMTKLNNKTGVINKILKSEV